MDNFKTKINEGGAPLNAPISEDDKDQQGPTSENTSMEIVASEDSSECSSADTIVGDRVQGAQVPTCSDTESMSTTAEIKGSLEELELEESKKKRKRLSGAARKRLAHLKLAGIPHEVALAQCQIKITDRTVSTVKRSRSDDTTPKGTPAKREKKERPLPTEAKGTSQVTTGPKLGDSGSSDEAKLSYKDAVKAIRLEITDQGFPEVKLGISQILAVQDCIMDAVAELPMDGISPTFLGCRTRNGWLTVNCADKDTAEWLTVTVPNLKPWDNANLRVVGEDELPRPKIFFVYLPRCKNEANEKILRRLGVQNKELRNAEWKVLARKDRENDFLQLTLSVSHKTAETLKASNYKVNWLFGAVYFRPKKDGERSNRAEKTHIPTAGKAGVNRSVAREPGYPGSLQKDSGIRNDQNKPGPSGTARRQRSPGKRNQPGKKHGLCTQSPTKPHASSSSTQGSSVEGPKS